VGANAGANVESSAPSLPPVPTGPVVSPVLDESGIGSPGSDLHDFNLRSTAGAGRMSTTRLLLAALGGAVVVLGVAALVNRGLGGASSGQPGTLTIASLPSAAEVRLDGSPLPTPTPVTIAGLDTRKPHRVMVGLRGYEPWESDVRFEAGAREVRVQAALTPISGVVAIDSQPPGAEAIVNGRIAGVTPTTVDGLLPTGSVTIELRLSGYKVAHKTVAWPVGDPQGSQLRLAKSARIEVSIPLEKAQ
jgi:hypothetical protein